MMLTLPTEKNKEKHREDKNFKGGGVDEKLENLEEIIKYRLSLLNFISLSIHIFLILRR